MDFERLVAGIAAARIGDTFNQYAHGPRAALLRRRLVEYLESREHAPVVLCGEAPGYRGARVSGIPFTSERQLTGDGPGELTATVVHDALHRLRLLDDVLLWNVVPTHPGTASSNRRPAAAEIEAGTRFLGPLVAGRYVIAVGRIAEKATGAPYIRHPARGGAAAFVRGLADAVARAPSHDP